MKKIYAISIHKNFCSVLQIEKKRGLYKILEEEVLQTDELLGYLQDKKNYYIVIHQEELLDDIITVPSVIKNKNVLYSYVIKRFKDSLPTKNLLLNYYKISEDKEEKTVTYKIDAIDKKEYMQYLRLIPDWKSIKSATIDKFALLNLTRKCFEPVKGFGSFSVYSYGNAITVLAIDDQGRLLFERTSNTIGGIEKSQFLNFTEEINQTVAYVQQQFRSNEFSTILISGSLSLDDEVAHHLQFSTGMGIGVLYPNTFLEGLQNEEPQQYVVTIGSLFVSKKDMFFPVEVLSTKQYAFALNLLLGLASLALITSSYAMYEGLQKYTTTLQRYDSIKERLLHLIKTTDTYPLEQLQQSYIHLQVAENFLRSHPLDVLIRFKPLLAMLPPKTYEYDDRNRGEDPIIELSFQKRFDTLEALYTFENSFRSLFKQLNKENRWILEVNSNYSKIDFKAKIMTPSKQTKQPRRRKRRL